jgi:two-component system, chemotaxis family, protein-glutamate methylesterase/glutaminase
VDGTVMVQAAAQASASGGTVANPIRVMVVDDSAVIRGLLTRTLEADPDLAVVASVGNGQMAISALGRADTDVVVLDIEMPVMDGLTALPKLLEASPDVKVIIASTLTQKNAQISLKALSAGASDYVAKPTSSQLNAASDFKRELVEKVKALGRARRAARQRAGGAAQKGDLPFRPPVSSKPIVISGPTVLRKPSNVPPSVIAIGSSTGGPQALFSVLAALPASLNLPILITQHMPPTFTTILAQHLTRVANRPAAEAVDGEPVKPGRIYLAPGDFHMRVETNGAERVLRLSKDPPENFCRPAVDPMLRSLAQVYGPAVLTVILTGMGSDGAKGGAAVVDAGGTVVAQDEATSVVWGMPGAAAAAGICSAILSISDVAPQIVRLAGGGRA